MKYDAIIIGSGAAGYYFAISAAKKGKKIAIVERDVLGGTAFATGCLPVKKHLEVIKTYKEMKKNTDLIQLKFDISKENLFDMGHSKVNQIETHLINRLDENLIELIKGEGVIIDSTHVSVDKNIYETDCIIIATGTSAAQIKNWPDIDEKMILSHKGLINMKSIPKELTILGGNVEGIEFASLFSSLGTKVKIIEREELILLGNDRDLVEPIKKQLEAENVQIMLNENLENIVKEENHLLLKLSSETNIITENLLITGIRKANTPVCKNITIENENGYIKVDKNLMTNVNGIYAIGDINSIHGMAHVAIQQAILLVDYIWENKEISFDYESLPRCIFTINELAGAGWQEEGHLDVEVIKIFLKDTIRGNELNEDSFLKLILENKIIKGAWINDTKASEIMGQIGLWIDKEINIEEFKKTLWIHPTITESFLEGALY